MPARAAHSLPVHDIDQVPIADVPGRGAPAQLRVGAPAVVQRVIDIGTKRAAFDRKAKLIAALKERADTTGVVWLPDFDTMLDADLKSDKVRSYANLDDLLTDMDGTKGKGPLSAPAQPLKRTLDQARAVRQGVKFHRTHERNPSQPNRLATGFHDIPKSRMLKTPPGIRLVRLQSQYFYYRQRDANNKADFQVHTTGNPADPGYIYTDQGQFQGNLDVKDKTKKWSRQKRKQKARKYMNLGSQYKYPEHTVGHLAPFEHSPFVHDRPVVKGSTNTYIDTDSFEHNVVIENPYVGEQLKRAQVEAQMMKDDSYFLQMPVYSSTSPTISTTFNSKPIVPGQTDSSGNPVVDKPRVRPDELVFGVEKGSGLEWAAYDNTGKTRYDTKETKRQRWGYETRTGDWTKWTGKRVRPGSHPSRVWEAEKQATTFPYLADVYTPSTSTQSYEPWLDSTKAGVPGYQSPPPSPYYLGNSTPLPTHVVKGFVTPGETVTTTTGAVGIVSELTYYDSTTEQSTVLLQYEPQLFK
ncbi:hypothetical protein [Sphingomonas sp.]|uniref:hypothetical protein n=1 Tax=Sphingomonas sp. TaxID=28214 RepID=UPI003D6CCEA3